MCSLCTRKNLNPNKNKHNVCSAMHALDLRYEWDNADILRLFMHSLWASLFLFLFLALSPSLSLAISSLYLFLFSFTLYPSFSLSLFRISRPFSLALCSLDAWLLHSARYSSLLMLLPYRTTSVVEPASFVAVVVHVRHSI